MKWLDVAAGFVALPPPERADHAINPSATPPSHRAVVRRRLRSPMLMEDVLCRFPYDLFACAGRGAPFAFGAPPPEPAAGGFSIGAGGAPKKSKAGRRIIKAKRPPRA